MNLKVLLRTATAAAGLLAAATPAVAGPPFVTDDPVPTDPGHWEVYGFASGSSLPGGTVGRAGLDINYGAMKDLQLTAIIPIDFESRRKTGLGDVELAVKYRFVHQAADSWTPDIAVFPGVVTPTTSHPIATDRVSILLPIWAQKDFGKWSVFGGGGYNINPGAGNRNFWLSGLGVTREVTDRITLGAEVYRQTPNTPEGKVFVGLNFGAVYKVTDHWSLLASAGPGIQNSREGGLYDVYFALEATY